MSEATRERAPEYRGKRLLFGGLIAAVLGLGLFILGLVLNPAQALFSYLTAYAYVLSLALGALVFLMLAFVTRGNWQVVLRHLAGSITFLMPLLALLFLPIALGVEVLYPWARPELVTEHHLLELIEHRRPYLNEPFFWLRAVLYFLVWNLLAIFLWRYIKRSEQKDPLAETNARKLSAVGLLLVGITLSFASFDWLMSLTVEFYSTVFGLYYFAGGFLAALSLLVLVTYLVDRAHLLESLINKSHYYALGRLLLTFVIFWAYMAYAQGFIIYIANKPEEVPWYVTRTNGGWGVVGVILGIVHFGIPFLLLLLHAIKFRPRLLALIAVWLLLAHYLDLYWVVLPNLRPEGAFFHWLDLATLVGVVGLAVAWVAFLMRNRRLVPTEDPGLWASVHYQSQ